MKVLGSVSPPIATPGMPSIISDSGFPSLPGSSGNGPNSLTYSSTKLKAAKKEG